MTDHYVKNKENVYEIGSASAQQEGVCAKYHPSNSINFECADFVLVQNERGDCGWIRAGKNACAHLVIINEGCCLQSCFILQPVFKIMWSENT